MVERGCKPNVVTYTTIIDVLCKDELDSEALDIFSQMRNKGISPNVVTYRCLIRGLCNLGKINQALALLNEKVGQNISPDAYIFNILINIFSRKEWFQRHKDVLKALQLIDEMVDKDVPINKGFCQKGLPDEAYKVFRGIEEGGCLLDAYCYNVIIQGSLRHKDVPKALQLIDEMVDKGFFADATTTDLIYIYRAITISF
ncbi:hypothetical protein GH714_043422 [Hevea brasiliensis]|uniref:Pentacotripeptide-repeat region of PRORP domain-containing protein n=1 Tax=Hevea brasiliensis TaxID=3981 RepID=A0A6A6K6Q5_HEVBR|nr:hypothetical protein GH714_043422 [Hevea brasiliensis]